MRIFLSSLCENLFSTLGFDGLFICLDNIGELSLESLLGMAVWVSCWNEKLAWGFETDLELCFCDMLRGDCGEKVEDGVTVVMFSLL